MPLVIDVLAVILDCSLLGPQLSFLAQLRLAGTNRACRRLYAFVWHLMWRARARTAVTAPSRAITHEVRRMLRLAVEYSKPEHVSALLLGAVGEREQQRFVILRQLIDGQTYLHIAARLIRNRFTSDRLAVLELLLKAGGRDLACQTLVKIRHDDVESNATALHLCATGQSVPAAKALVRTGGSPLLMARTSVGATCLHLGVTSASSSTAVIEALVDLGGDPLLHAKDNLGNTCLLKAAAAGRVDHVRALLRAGGASLLTSCNDNGASCLFVAAQTGRLAVVEELIRSGGRQLLFATLTDGTSCLSVAALHAYLDVVLCLLAHGGRELALISTTDNNANALHFAATKGSRAIVEALIACAGSELLMQRLDGGVDEGRTCLHLAAAEGSCDVVEVLIDRGGADLLLATDHQDRSALFLAVGQGHYDIVVRMVYAGGWNLLSLNKIDGVSCLVLAAKRGYCQIFCALVSFVYEFRKDSEGKLTNQSANKYYKSELKLAMLAARFHGHKDVVEFIESLRRKRPGPPPPPPKRPLPQPLMPLWMRDLTSNCCIC